MSEELIKKIKTILPGKRVIKTVIAVYICFVIGILRNTSPYHSVIAAILCMQIDTKHSWEVGKNRVIGTLIGGAYGFITLVIVEQLNLEFYNYVYYLILSLILIPIIYSNIYLKVQKSIFMSCVVFMIITVSEGRDASIINFAFNRVLDTIIGIGVSLAVNNLIFKQDKTKEGDITKV